MVLIYYVSLAVDALFTNISIILILIAQIRVPYTKAMALKDVQWSLET